MSGNLWIDSLRNLASIFLLALSSYQDVKIREIDDIIWWAFIIAAFGLNLLDSFLGGTDPLNWIMSATLQSILFVVLYYLGLFGGADAKAFLCLSFMYPTSLALFLSNLANARLTTAVSTFSNAMILSMAYLPMNLFRNISLHLGGNNLFEGLEQESSIRKVAALLLLRKIERSEFISNRQKYLIGQHRKHDNRIELTFSRDIAEDAQKTELDPDLTYVFASPLMPLQVFILIGLIFYLIGGDILLSSSLWLARTLRGQGI